MSFGLQKVPGQVGGSHYEDMAIQPWEIIERNGLDFWEGSCLKYLLRWKTKNGVEDLKKAKHYIDYLISREEENAIEREVMS